MNEETKEKYNQAEDALLDFIIRVAQGKTTSEKEVEVLPEVVKSFFGTLN